MQPDDRRYTTEHEWIKLDGDTALVGITDFAAESLGDIVYVELPKVGDTVVGMGVAGTVESVKAVSELYAPVAGTVTEINGQLESQPELVNEAPFEAGWLYRMTPDQPSDIDALLTAQQYAAHIAKS